MIHLYGRQHPGTADLSKAHSRSEDPNRHFDDICSFIGLARAANFHQNPSLGKMRPVLACRPRNPNADYATLSHDQHRRARQKIPKIAQIPSRIGCAHLICSELHARTPAANWQSLRAAWRPMAAWCRLRSCRRQSEQPRQRTAQGSLSRHPPPEHRAHARAPHQPGAARALAELLAKVAGKVPHIEHHLAHALAHVPGGAGKIAEPLDRDDDGFTAKHGMPTRDASCSRTRSASSTKRSRNISGFHITAMNTK